MGYHEKKRRMARKPKVQARVSHDLKAAVEDYADEREDISNPEAVRELLRTGLAQKGHPVATADGGTLRHDLEEVQNEIRRTGTGTIVAVAYLAVAVLAPPTLPASLGLTAVGILLAVGLWYAGMINLSVFRGDTDE
jgi:hypothetical protein